MERDGFIKAVQIMILTMGLAMGVDYYLKTAAVPESQAAPVPPSRTAESNAASDGRLRRDLDQALEILATCFGGPIELERIRSEPITITAYSSTVDQCDATPYITASMQPVRPGIIAVSDDLVKELGLQFGQRVLIPGHGIFEVQDRMHRRWRRTVDIWVADREAALLFGRRKGTLFWVAPTEKENEAVAQESGSRTQEARLREKRLTPET